MAKFAKWRWRPQLSRLPKGRERWGVLGGCGLILAFALLVALSDLWWGEEPVRPEVRETGPIGATDPFSTLAPPAASQPAPRNPNHVEPRPRHGTETADAASSDPVAEPETSEPLEPRSSGPVRQSPGAPSPADWIVPLDGELGLAFGWQLSPTMGDWRWHDGIDLIAAPGTPVRSAAAGRVAVAETTGDWGGRVVIDHGGGVESVYAGLTDLRIREGETVGPGALLGEVGPSPLREAAAAPHLHFAVREAGRPVDPTARLSQLRSGID